LHFIANQIFLETHYNTENLNITNPVVTVGFFDGVHLGHQALLKQVTEKAQHIHGESVVITLWPHPRMVLSSNPGHLHFITSLEEKLCLLEKAGIEHVVILNFTKELAQLTAQEFIFKFLIKDLKAHTLIIGFNNFLGSDRQGGYNTISSISSNYGLNIIQHDEYLNENEKISSTVIRQSISKGNLELAYKLLGRYYFIQGKVVKGMQLGRTIGFPTANIETTENLKLIPADGVYAVIVHCKNNYYGGMLNIGYRPTVDNEKKRKTIEAHLFDFNADIYGEIVMVNFVSRLRNEIKFSNIETLQQQLATDKRIASEILVKHNNKELL
jgi:riboflavin kinase/FMN adenylyltransferase